VSSARKRLRISRSEFLLIEVCFVFLTIVKLLVDSDKRYQQNKKHVSSLKIPCVRIAALSLGDV
jgi:hypothetical protein